jgi:hypothetical protein
VQKRPNMGSPWADFRSKKGIVGQLAPAGIVFGDLDGMCTRSEGIRGPQLTRD